MGCGIEPEYELAGYKYVAIDLDDYQLPATEAELHDRLKDPIFRICNIYKIINKQGEEIKFVPNWAQRVVLYAIFILGLTRIAIPKARQLGFSTLAAIILLDQTYFGKNKQASITDITQGDASEKLDKCRISYELLPPQLLEGSSVDSNSTKELSWGNGSSINAGKNARGGTNQFVHASEIGVVAYEDPRRAAELISGAFPTVPTTGGLIIAESTYKGGKGGDWYDIIDSGLTTAPEHRTVKDWLVLFFPWYLDASYSLEGDASQIDPETLDYFKKAEARLGFKFTPGQKLWYFKEKRLQKDKMKREFPTFIEEMWQVREPGTIFATAMDKQLALGKINDNVCHFEGFPVYTAWDIGAPLNTKCWIFQIIGDRIKFLESLTGGPDCATPAQWVARLRLRTEYSYGGHFLPHDGENLWKAAFEEAGLKYAAIVPRCMWVWDPINDALAAMSRCEFNAKQCEPGIDALNAYRSKQDTDGVTVQNIPVHDWCLSTGTQVLTTRGWRSVESVCVNNEVLTPRGAMRVLRSGIVRHTSEWTTVRGIKCTPEHRFFTNRGLVQAGELLSQDKLWTRQGLAPSTLACLCAVFRLGFKEATMLGTREKAGKTGGLFFFTGLFTRLLMDRFRKVTRYITRTITRSTITPTTLRQCLDTNIGVGTSPNIDSSAFAECVGNRSGAIRISAQGAAQSASESITHELRGSEELEPAYNLTIDVDECYYVRGSDGVAYLVSNSSHYSKAFECAHAAIRAGMVVDRSAIPERGVQSSKIKVITGTRGEYEERVGRNRMRIRR